MRTCTSIRSLYITKHGIKIFLMLDAFYIIDNFHSIVDCVFVISIRKMAMQIKCISKMVNMIERKGIQKSPNQKSKLTKRR